MIQGIPEFTPCNDNLQTNKLEKYEKLIQQICRTVLTSRKFLIMIFYKYNE